MNLRELKFFVITRMAGRLIECGIGIDHIEQIKIHDRQIPSNDNDNNMVWMIKTDDIIVDTALWKLHSYSAVVAELIRWIDTQIMDCYMNEKPDRDLSIEIRGNGKSMMAI